MDELDVVVTVTQPENMVNNEPCREHLITYSQVNRNILLTKQDFAIACANAFGIERAIHNAACEERHERGGIHYHVAIKLNAPQRWSGRELF